MFPEVIFVGEGGAGGEGAPVFGADHVFLHGCEPTGAVQLKGGELLHGGILFHRIAIAAADGPQQHGEALGVLQVFAGGLIGSIGIDTEDNTGIQPRGSEGLVDFVEGEHCGGPNRGLLFYLF